MWPSSLWVSIAEVVLNGEVALLGRVRPSCPYVNLLCGFDTCMWMHHASMHPHACMRSTVYVREPKQASSSAGDDITDEDMFKVLRTDAAEGGQQGTGEGQQKQKGLTRTGQPPAAVSSSVSVAARSSEPSAPLAVHGIPIIVCPEGQVIEDSDGQSGGGRAMQLHRPSAAVYALQNPAELQVFLEQLMDAMAQSSTGAGTGSAGQGQPAAQSGAAQGRHGHSNGSSGALSLERMLKQVGQADRAEPAVPAAADGTAVKQMTV